ncbi:MAG: hypothetical protein QOC79_2993 [Actinomycetota bacterium]|nr:hypothetical protein [Actinomycetota bacterium]
MRALWKSTEPVRYAGTLACWNGSASVATVAADAPRAHRDRDREQHDHEQRRVLRRLVEEVPDHETEHAKGADRVDDLPPRCNLPVLSYESHGKVSISPSAIHVPGISCPSHERKAGGRRLVASRSVATRPYTHRARGYRAALANDRRISASEPAGGSGRVLHRCLWTSILTLGVA